MPTLAELASSMGKKSTRELYDILASPSLWSKEAIEVASNELSTRNPKDISNTASDEWLPADKPKSLQFGKERLLAQIPNTQPDRICKCGERFHCVHIVGHSVNWSKPHNVYTYKCNSCGYSINLHDPKSIKRNKILSLVCIGLIALLMPFVRSSNLADFLVFAASFLVLAAIFYFSSKRQNHLQELHPFASNPEP